MTYDEVLGELYALADEKYKTFSERIINTALPILGVRTPALRALGKRIKRQYTDFAEDFFARKEYTHEEVLLCGWQMGRDYDANAALLKRLIPRFADWAHTDQILDCRWVKDPERLLADFAYLKAGGEYEVRAFVMMMFGTCVTAERLPLISRELPTVPLGVYYYVDMAAAWLLCEVVVKFYDEGVRLLSSDYLTSWVLKKAVSKCRDSFRLTAEQKSELKQLVRRARSEN